MKISKDNRLRVREIHNQLKQIENRITSEVKGKYSEETKLLMLERRELFKEQKQFINQVAEFVKVGQKVKVSTQVGPNGGDIIKSYEGTITKVYTSKATFNLSDPNYLDGKEFTIGGSCIQSFEVIEQ